MTGPPAFCRRPFSSVLPACVGPKGPLAASKVPEFSVPHLPTSRLTTFLVNITIALTTLFVNSFDNYFCQFFQKSLKPYFLQTTFHLYQPLMPLMPLSFCH